MATPLDWLLMVLGTLGALGHGMIFPLYAILFGDMANIFGGYRPACLGFPPPPPGTPVVTNAMFNDQIADIALRFLYMALGAFVASYLQQACWSLAGNRCARLSG